MKIGELFVELGITGTKKSAKALAGIRSSLKEVSNVSLETKAGIAGVFYGLERMMSFATSMGAGLKQFAVLTGMSAENLQKWQYAGRQVNVTNEAMESSFKGVQNAIGNMLIGKGAPEGMGILADAVGLDMNRLQDTVYMMTKLQEFAAKYQGNPVLANTVLRSFGLTDDVIVGMRQMAFTKEKMANAQIISDKDIHTLSVLKNRLSEVGHSFKITMASIVSESFPKIVSEIENIANHWNGVFRDNADDIVNTWISAFETIKTITGLIADGWKSIFGWIEEFSGADLSIKGILNSLKEVAEFLRPNQQDSLFERIKEVAHGTMEGTGWDKTIWSKMVMPERLKEMKNDQNVNIYQTVSFVQGAKDLYDQSKQATEVLKRGVENTFRQMPQGIEN